MIWTHLDREIISCRSFQFRAGVTLMYFTTHLKFIYNYFLNCFKKFGRHVSFLCCHWYPSFGPLMTSALCFKTRVDIAWQLPCFMSYSQSLPDQPIRDPTGLPPHVGQFHFSIMTFMTCLLIEIWWLGMFPGLTHVLLCVPDIHRYQLNIGKISQFGKHIFSPYHNLTCVTVMTTDNILFQHWFCFTNKVILICHYQWMDPKWQVPFKCSQ